MRACKTQLSAIPVLEPSSSRKVHCHASACAVSAPEPPPWVKTPPDVHAALLVVKVCKEPLLLRGQALLGGGRGRQVEEGLLGCGAQHLPLRTDLHPAGQPAAPVSSTCRQ
ncbi:hypothetical protein HaLaN_17982 [Haematococcus lacustris]|uniref:Uncharacterized protein n=1 Tax=Haematococcus lacustris TaxID=44745 RepID=A0A699ZXU5_HAELA|nr:hypothetical protein HaLaN_17982 [Haematococcus lacustris]